MFNKGRSGCLSILQSSRHPRRIRIRSFATTAINIKAAMHIDTKYKMPSGYNIPVLGFGVRSQTNFYAQMLLKFQANHDR